MATTSSIVSPVEVLNRSVTGRQINGTAMPDSSVPNGRATTSATSHQLATKYRHIVAVHSKQRASCLSHDSEAAPSFLGFRNLMVIVLGKLFLPEPNYFSLDVEQGIVLTELVCLVVMNLRLVVENFVKA